MPEEHDNAYNLFFDNNPSGCLLAEIDRDRYRHPEDFTIVKVNMEYARLLGLARVTIMDMDLFDVLPGGRDDWQNLVIRVTSNGRAVTGTSYWDITDTHLNVSMFLPRRDLLAVIISDVSTECLTTGTVARHESQQDSILRAAPELVCRFLPDGTLTYANRAYCDFFEKKREELSGHCFLDAIPDDELEFVRSRLSMLNRNQASVTYKHSVREGTEKRWIEWTDIALFDDNGSIAEYQSVGRDITERHLEVSHIESVAGYMDDLLYYRAREHNAAEAVVSETTLSTQALSTDVEDMRREIEDLRKKTITGELGVCRACNRVHDDKGHWLVVPMFLENHTAANVDLQVCPYCKSKAERDLKRRKK